MSRVRFATATDLFETFPELVKEVGVPPNDRHPIDFLKGLSAQGKLKDAIAFCAYLLPRREAVQWSCQSVRTLSAARIPNDKAAGLLAAEAWVQQPDTDHRLAALDLGVKGDPDDPMTYLAFAAGWAGGVLFSHPESPVPMPANMTPKAAKTAIMLAAHYTDEKHRPERLRACIEDGAKLAVNGL